MSIYLHLHFSSRTRSGSETMLEWWTSATSSVLKPVNTTCPHAVQLSSYQLLVSVNCVHCNFFAWGVMMTHSALSLKESTTPHVCCVTRAHASLSFRSFLLCVRRVIIPSANTTLIKRTGMLTSGLIGKYNFTSKRLLIWPIKHQTSALFFFLSVLLEQFRIWELNAEDGKIKEP